MRAATITSTQTFGGLNLHQGTREGQFEGVAPTGKRVDFRTMVINRFADGIVVENWGLHDHASVLAQLRPESSDIEGGHHE